VRPARPQAFESSVAQAVTAIAATASGLEQSVAALLGVLQRFVGYDLAGVLLALSARPTSPSARTPHRSTTPNS
jgi:hypothetical protein